MSTVFLGGYFWLYNLFITILFRKRYNNASCLQEASWRTFRRHCWFLRYISLASPMQAITDIFLQKFNAIPHGQVNLCPHLFGNFALSIKVNTLCFRIFFECTYRFYPVTVALQFPQHFLAFARVYVTLNLNIEIILPEKFLHRTTLKRNHV